MLYKLTFTFMPSFSTTMLAAEEAQESSKQVLFKSVYVFDGKNDKLTMGTYWLRATRSRRSARA